LKDAETDISGLAPTVNGAVSPEKKRKKTAKEPLLFDQEEATSEPPKKKQKTDKKGKDSKKSAKPRILVFDLVEPEFEHSKSKPVPLSSVSDAADSFGERTVLQSSDAADKKARNKSLRFHTSKIEGAVTRRDKGAKNLLGGDDDIPYKERRKQKEIRETKENAKKGRGLGGDDLSDGDPEADMDVDFAGFDGDFGGGKLGKKRRRDDSSEEHEDADPGEYYSLVERSAKEKKGKKKAEYDATKAAERCVLPGPRLPHALLTSVTPGMPWRLLKPPTVREH
jgi:U3 small nucleolar RNA-associated protein 3